jgi:hypothetical protein
VPSRETWRGLTGRVVRQELDGEDAMIFRFSQKLSTKIKAGALKPAPLHKNPFADWSAHLFVADRTQYILVSNTKSLYSSVLYAKGITNDSHFIERALSNLREFMEDDGQEFVYKRFIAPASASVFFAKALDRSVTGSMNELIKYSTVWLAEGDVAPFDVGFRLNNILLSAPVRNDSVPYGTPRDSFKGLVSSMER